MTDLLVTLGSMLAAIAVAAARGKQYSCLGASFVRRGASLQQRRVRIGPATIDCEGAHMDHKLIQYRVKPEQRAANEQLIRDVFAELRARAVTGVRYLVLRQEDGTFTHFVVADDGGPTTALTSLASFQRFQHGVRERCAVLPTANPALVVGNHRMLADGSGQD
jgi:hypothetical protein